MESRIVKSVYRFGRYLEGGVLVAFAVSATGIMFGNSVSRYLFRSSFAWADEAIRLIFVWSMFIAITTAFFRNQHISFLAVAHLNRRLRLFSEVLSEATLLVIGLVVVYYGNRFMRLTGAVRLPGTELPSGLLLLPGVVSGAAWTLLGFGRLLNRLIRLVTGKPPALDPRGDEPAETLNSEEVNP